MLARSLCDKPNLKMLKQGVVKWKEFGYLSLFLHHLVNCFLYCPTPYYPSIRRLHPCADGWPTPSFASPLNLALLSYKIHVQVRCPKRLRRWGGSRELQGPESVWEMIKPLQISSWSKQLTNPWDNKNEKEGLTITTKPIFSGDGELSKVSAGSHLLSVCLNWEL